MKDKLIEKMYEISKKPYQKWLKKNKPWNISSSELMVLPEASLGYELGSFLLRYNFQIQEKLEDHDVIHVLTNTGISVVEEIGMQYYLLGNGKKSLYLFLVIITGFLFYPKQIDYYLIQYQKGKKAHRFYDLDFYKMLTIPVTNLRKTFNII
ncbi:conserved hypothetical protein [Flavobacterium sp. 9AF]|uniref:hypothetical protein n=1 Tax=Flavobacterium sp. 9AF TaxID=2653142 RepID=UPI0012F20F0B|nr:hypothetical protein [Flavobacterium sp. 9AF]VXB69351.1 conserved hypothetical protein [Flavobacterium sp. 9AF]